jgi:hypothetical protein
MTRVDFHNTFTVACLLILSLFVVPHNAHAQFIDVSLNVDSKLTASTERALDFGTLTANSGRQTIQLGSPNMGIFSITALENEMLLVTLTKPTQLRHEDAGIGRVVPLELVARYGYSLQNIQNSSLLPEAVSKIKVEPNTDPSPWNNIYIFIYGTVNIGNIPDGNYYNDIILNVEYI